MNHALRNLTRLVTVLAMGLGLASCNENEKPQAAAPVVPKQGFLQSLGGTPLTYNSTEANNPASAGMAGGRNYSLPGADLTPVTAQQSPSAAAAAQQPQMNIPKDARWTLYCTSLTGPDRIARATQLKSYLLAHSPFRDWYVVHNEQDSTLFYGFYSSVERNDNPRAAERAHADRKAIGEWKDETGQRPFQACFFVPITPPNPVAPAEWNLENAPPDRYWSVQIMAFQDNALRKQAAVQAVKDLRDKGVEAYYYHGETISSVCVGSWPRQAVKQQESDSGRAMNEDDAVLVSNVPLPARFKNARLRTADGKRVVSYAQRVEIADPSLQATFNQFPDHAVNYEIQRRKIKDDDGKVHDVSDPSFLVVIPRPEASALSGNGLQNFNGVGNGMAPRPGSDNTPAGAARLRGVGN
jgi:hypothetical protein